MTDLTRLPLAPATDDDESRREAFLAIESGDEAASNIVVFLVDPGECGAEWSTEMRRIGSASRDAARRSSGPVHDDPWVGFHRRLLASLGGSRSHPPRLEPGWEVADVADRFVAEATDLFSRFESQSSRHALIDDPSLGLLLPLWRRVLDRPMAAVLLVATPELVAKATAAPGSPSAVHLLARYERNLRSALQGLEGMPVVVATQEDTGAPRFAGQIAALLDLGGDLMQSCSTLDGRPDGEALGPITAAGPSSGSLVTPELSRLYRVALELRGVHARLPRVEVGEESPWTAELLGLGADLEHVADALSWASEQLESVVRVTPPSRHDRMLALTDEKATDDAGDAGELGDQEEDGPYPLSAAEDRHAYHRWLMARRLPVIVGGIDSPSPTRPVTRVGRHPSGPKISIVVPVWQTPRWALERCVGSVFAQTYANWELCLCDDASGDPDLSDYLNSLRRVDRRIKVTALGENSGISAATNAAIGMADGDFIAFLDHDDELTAGALSAVADAIAQHSDADVLYSDEDKIDPAGERFDPLFKPDWSPDLLLSFAYLCHLTVVRRTVVEDLGGLRSAFDGSQDFDLSLRATERARTIVHIPEILYHWRTLPGSAATDSVANIAKPWAYAAGARAIEDALERRGEPAEVTMMAEFPGRYHVRRRVTGSPRVSIIIPFRDEPSLLATCASSLRADPGHDNIELVLVDNGSELPETEALLDRLSEDANVKIIRSPGPFNWAAINNEAAAQAGGDLLLFANNDIEARRGRWLDAMVGHAQRPEVGAVGAGLVYPDGAIQHAGVVIGLGGIAGHVLRGLPGDRPGYNSMAIQTRNCSVVTGACMLTRREVFEEVGGFDEQLPVAFNDVDFCLKLRDRGYLVVFTPLAELVHHESRSRGHTDDLVEHGRIVDRWATAIAMGDPYMNVNLSHWRYWCPLSTPQEDYRWKTYLERSVLTHASSSSS